MVIDHGIFVGLFYVEDGKCVSLGACQWEFHVLLLCVLESEMFRICSTAVECVNLFLILIGSYFRPCGLKVSVLLEKTLVWKNWGLNVYFLGCDVKCPLFDG